MRHGDHLTGRVTIGACMQVVKVVAKHLLDVMAGFHGGLLGEDHSWV